MFKRIRANCAEVDHAGHPTLGTGESLDGDASCSPQGRAVSASLLPVLVIEPVIPDPISYVAGPEEGRKTQNAHKMAPFPC